MSATTPSKSPSSSDLLKQAVYQRNGSIFFRTTVQKATAFEQKQLDAAKAKLQKLTSS
ncbi:UNVERIFIED_CONTAM: hypothetical protein Sradi_1085200 [Sesamum radiatum]|uniref:Uncharacterized protein n=1 Tax=Sesamum radiatum TaxID=300843 RepID=A0AAW2V936_SESRA